ncbi:MAG: UDP-N-acetylenolpyruvoylglucosamine reductase [Candidatus Anoxychlamydiales bacterium]|uniref:UDP-N-acetylmuramate dehydrogenase n=1 Tax=marine sediment metagenome TaxID=412755 RepID=A0A0F9FGT9_9ZZZZ|nr:UDP-N-acetylenolpyruvoylglucosamine reductase [Candidatus Anoxychlamydiales bacterium]
MEVQKNRSLKEFTTFKIGGRAKYFIEARTFDEMKQGFLFAKENNLKTFILGKGSNILFDDKGFSGLVIYNNINFLRIFQNNVYVGAGYSFPALGVKTANNNLSGLEFAAGVPGSLGGAIYMNASSYSQAVSDAIKNIVYLTFDGEIITLKKEECSFAYRNSIFQKMKGAILSSVFSLKKDNNAKKRQLEILQKKLKNQPMNEKNVGCIFKNPKNTSAKILIDECSLINYKIGEAIISEVHPNFIINENKATSKDVLKLISHIKKVVKKKKNITLIEEVKVISP